MTSCIHVLNFKTLKSKIPLFVYTHVFVDQGAWCGFVLSLLLTVWLGVGQQIYKPSTDKPPVSTACLDDP